MKEEKGSRITGSVGKVGEEPEDVVDVPGELDGKEIAQEQRLREQARWN